MNNVVILLALQNSYKMIQTAEKEKNDAAKNSQNISMENVPEKSTKEKRNGYAE